MKSTFRLICNILLGVAFAALGILILNNKESFIKIAMIGAGIVAIIEGLSGFFNVGKWQFEGVTKTLSIVRASLMLILGCLSIYAPFSTAKFLVTTYVYIFAVGLVFSAVVDIQNMVVLKRIAPELPRTSLIWDALIDFVLAVILFVNPTKIMGMAVTIIGIVAIILGIVYVVYTIKLYRYEKQ